MAYRKCPDCGLTLDLNDDRDDDHHLICSKNDADWVYPDGPWGWNPDGTSKATNAENREAHINWYHDYREMHDLDD